MIFNQVARAATPRIAVQAAARRMASTSTSSNPFIAERQAIKKHAGETASLWLKISVYACVPLITIASANAYKLWTEHWEHWSHLPPLEERTEYPYQNIRSKNFSWGDGDKTLFWNPEVNYHNKNKVK